MTVNRLNLHAAAGFLFFLWLWPTAAQAQYVEQTELVGIAGKCLDVLGSNTANRTPVVLFRCTGNDNQKWTVPERDSIGPIVGIGGKCLDVDGGNSTNRTPIQLYECTGNSNQQWRHELDGRLTGLDGKCLDVADGSTDDLSSIVLYDCQGSPNQLWRPRTHNRWTGMWPAGPFPDGFSGHVAVAPNDPNRVAAVIDGKVHRSTDGGTSWQTGVELPNQDTVNTLIHTGSEVFISGFHNGSAAQASLYRADADGGPWIAGGLQGMAGTILNHDISPRDGSDMLAVVQSLGDAALYRSHDGGNNWFKTLEAGILFGLARSPANADRIYTGSSDCVFRSDNGGNTWRRVSPFVFRRFAADAQDGATVFGSGGATIWRSQDAGLQWTLLDLPAGQRGSISALVTSQTRSGRVAFATTSGQVFLSNDMGDSWVSLEAGSQSQSLTSLIFDPQDDQRLWAASPRRLQQGEWSLEPTNNQTMFLGTNDRFAVQLNWIDGGGGTGPGRPTELTQDTGYFWFFSNNNVEVVVKVLDARNINGHFWVFYGSLSDVEYTLTITDTVTGEVRNYTNPLGTLGSGSDVTAF